MIKTKQAKKTEQLDLELEDEKTRLDISLERISDPAKYEEARKRLAEYTEKLEIISKESQITMKKIFAEAKQERGLTGKVAQFIKGLKDKAKSNGSTSYSSITFLGGTVKAINSYQQTIPVYIKEFKTAIAKLKEGQEEARAVMKGAYLRVKQVSKEWEAIKKKIEAETDKQKKEELKIQEQDIRDILQNAEIKGNKYMKKLQNYTYSREMFLGLKSAYETLLKQLGDLEENLKEHLKILKIVGPAIKEVESVVRSFNKFTQAIEDYKRRDNLSVRYSVKAVKEITPASKKMEDPWFDEKTVEEVKKDSKEAKEIYKQHFGKDINTLEELEKLNEIPDNMEVEE